MGMGSFDEDEQQRKDEKTGDINYEEDDELNTERYEGDLEFEGGSTEELLEHFKMIKDPDKKYDPENLLDEEY